jgi:hypothetical protein
VKPPSLSAGDGPTGPLILVAGLAVADTAYFPVVVTAIDRLTCVTDLATLLKHLSSTVALAALLDWVITLEHPASAGRRLR